MTQASPMPVTSDDVARALAGRVRGDVLTDRFSRSAYATAACIYRIVPLAVVVPKTADDVAETVRTAAALGVSVVPRGAGSGLCGQALGRGIVIDFTKYMNRVVALDAPGRLVRVQPGAVTGKVNEALAGHGLMLGPDPSSEPFCTIGGNVGNNASGARGIRYGSMREHVAALDVVLADGSRVRLESGEADGSAYRELAARGDLLGRIVTGTRQVLEDHADLLRANRPYTSKHSAGYNLFDVLDAGRFDLTRLVTGSEGTLAIVVEATLRAVEKPRERASLLLWFADLEQAGEAVRPILDLGPAACEVMERRFLDIVRADGSVPEKYLPPEADTVLLVEQISNSRAENEAFIRRVRERVVDDLGLAFGSIEAYDPAEQERLWLVRKRAVQILQRLPGPKRITPFIEDVSVPPDRLVEYIRGIREICGRHGAEVAIYGHAGDSNLHARPILDTRKAEDVARMQAIADEVAALTIRLGGTVSCEHGDGLTRSGYLELQFGPDLYRAMADVKRVWDPAGVLNPGKIITDERHVHLDDLRMGPDFALQPTGEAFDRERWAGELVRCHGCGTCRGFCPVYKVTGDEVATPRGKANLLREILSGRLDLADLGAERMREVARLCYNCKSCRVECPSRVDVPGLVLLHKAHLASRGNLTLAERQMLNVRRIGRAGSALAPVANRVLGWGPARWLMEKLGGISRTAAMPRFGRPRLKEGTDADGSAAHADAAQVLQRSFPRGPYGPRKAGIRVFGAARTGRAERACHVAGLEAADEAGAGRKVAYFAGCFELFNEPPIGRSALAVLDALGCEVFIPEQRCCGIPRISAGDAAGAMRDMRFNLDVLAPLAEAGYAIVSGCPSCVLTLTEDYPEMAEGDDRARLVAKATRDVHALVDEITAGRAAPLNASPDSPWRTRRLAYHAPCHLRAAGRGDLPRRLVERLLGLEFVLSNAECCGMGGTYGLKAQNADTSSAIAQPVFDRIRASGAEAVVTSCGMCRTQLAHGTGLPVVHPMEILAEVLAASAAAAPAERAGEAAARHA